jgi:8-oxo-dGTP diphosphatase
VGAAGVEPAIFGLKVRCLSAWLRPRGAGHRSLLAVPQDRDTEQDEADFLAAYRLGRDSYPKAANTVDVALFAGRGPDRDGPGTGLCLLLIRRGGHPFRGSWALPGGFLELGQGDAGEGEGLEEGARRELEEETGIRLGGVRLTQLGTYGDPGRDPRGRTISTVFLAHLTEPPPVAGGDDAAEARWWPVGRLGSDQAPPLAFDHRDIVDDALSWARGQGLTDP